MGIFDFLHKEKRPEFIDDKQETVVACQMLVIQFFYGIEDKKLLHQMEDEIIQLLYKTGVGEYHGYEMSIDYGDGYLFIIGENADLLFSTVKPLLERYYFMDRSIATLRTGHFSNPGATETDYCIRFSKLNQN